MHINIRKNLCKICKKIFILCKKRRKSKREWVYYLQHGIKWDWANSIQHSDGYSLFKPLKELELNTYLTTQHTNRKADSCIFENTRQLPRWIMTGSSWQSKHKMPIEMKKINKNGDAAELRNQVSVSTARVSYSGTYFMPVCVCLHNSLEPLYITAAGERPRAKVLSVNGNRQS